MTPQISRGQDESFNFKEVTSQYSSYGVQITAFLVKHDDEDEHTAIEIVVEDARRGVRRKVMYTLEEIKKSESFIIEQYGDRAYFQIFLQVYRNFETMNEPSLLAKDIRKYGKKFKEGFVYIINPYFAYILVQKEVCGKKKWLTSSLDLSTPFWLDIAEYNAKEYLNTTPKQTSQLFQEIRKTQI